MTKITSRVAVPIILAGLFAIVSLIAIEYDKLDANFYIVFSFLAIYLFLFGFAIGERVSLPVKKILQRATELSEGDLKSRIYLGDKDELGELAKVFNKIAEELENSRLNAEKTENSVDIKVKARTESLEETIKALEQKVRNRALELEKIIYESKKMQEISSKKELEAGELKKELLTLKGKVKKYKSKKSSEGEAVEQ